MELEPRDAFYLAACEAYRDGRLEAGETALLLELRVVFGITREEAEAAMQRASKTAGSPDAEASPLSPLELYSQACRMALIDGDLEERERALLLELAGVLDIPEGEAIRLLVSAREEME